MAKYEILYIIRPNIEEDVVLHTKSKISVKDFTTS